ncbi:alpha/beta fold hydrolase [Actinacidiphila acididurans]|uniref:alpha/beta fold hydrolase n=1 Tax=Actinacidiphila acididurans TaxID=2784346 RepID=UPI001F1D4476|nr:hypothetical protein [Actinacidiphila acididurans]
MGILNDDFGQLFYDIAGDGPPAVFVHAGIARRYAAEIPGATLVEFATAAHLIAMDAPTELSAVLGPFLAR